MNSRPSHARRIVVYAQEFYRGGRALQALLNGFNIDMADSLEDAVSRPAGALILLMSGWPLLPDREPVARRILNRLKARRVVGIGYGAGNLFDAMGLEINSGTTIGAGRAGFHRIRLQPNDLLPDEDRLLAAIRPRRSRGIPMDFGLFIPERSYLRREVDVLARWTAMPDYAPVARQGHHVLIGFFDVRRWTSSFAAYFSRLIDSLLRLPRRPFRIARWDTTPPGRAEFQLTPYRSSVGDWTRCFHFRFRKPARFIATLRSRGSRKVRLLLHSVPSLAAPGGFAEGSSGKSLRILREITRDEILALSPGTWRLHVTNWDDARPAKCTLSLTY